MIIHSYIYYMNLNGLKKICVGRKDKKSSCSLRVSAEVPQTRGNEESSYGIRRATNPIAISGQKLTNPWWCLRIPEESLRKNLYWGSSFNRSHKKQEEGAEMFDREGGKRTQGTVLRSLTWASGLQSAEGPLGNTESHLGRPPQQPGWGTYYWPALSWGLTAV